MIVSGTQSLFGQMITDLIETDTRVGNSVAVALGLLTMIIATIGINIVANFSWFIGVLLGGGFYRFAARHELATNNAGLFMRPEMSKD